MQEGQGSSIRGNRLQVSDIFLSLKQQEETNYKCQIFFPSPYKIKRRFLSFFFFQSELYFNLLASSIFEQDTYYFVFFSMKGDGFQPAIICAHSFTLNMQHSGCTQGRLFLFHFHNFYAAARSFHGVCIEFGLQCISDCFCTDLGVSDVAESSLSPIRHHDVARGGASGRIAKTCQCRLRPRP